MPDSSPDGVVCRFKVVYFLGILDDIVIDIF